MRLKVLGCSGGEFPGHNSPGFLLDNEILFDAGSISNVLDLKGQRKIKNIFITHAHLDHIKGIPFLADNLSPANGRHKVSVIGIPPVVEAIKKNLLNGSIWPDFTTIPDRENGVLKFIRLKEGKSIKLNNYTITPYRVNHAVPAAGFLAEDAHKKRLFYTGDTGPTAATWKKIGNRQIHCLIIEVSYPNRMGDFAVSIGHLTSRLLKEEISKMELMPERIFITHAKPQYFRTIKAEINGLGMKNLRLLRDGEIIRI